MTWPNIDTFSFGLGVFGYMLLNLCEAFIRGFMRGATTHKPANVRRDRLICTNCEREFRPDDVHGRDTCTVMNSNGHFVQVTDVRKTKDNLRVHFSVDGQTIAEYVDKSLRKH